MDNKRFAFVKHPFSQTLMLGLALLPLIFYFFLFAVLHFRSKPTALSGEQDFMLLACGLFGMITLGPGRLLIPLSVLAFWHISTWIFWTLFYFALTGMLMQLRRRRKIVIYHCPMPLFMPKLLELGRQIDPQARQDGNVLFMPGLGVQCTVNGDVYGGHLVLQETGAFRDRLRWQHFQRGVNSICRSFRVPAGRSPVGWGLLMLAAVLTVVAVWQLEPMVLIEAFSDHWL